MKILKSLGLILFGYVCGVASKKVFMTTLENKNEPEVKIDEPFIEDLPCGCSSCKCESKKTQDGEYNSAIYDGTSN